MQDIYAFDVGDFGKVGLLRHLHRRTHLRLGVLWYRTHLGSAGADGKHVGYLKQQSYRECDPELWDEMARRFDPANRTIDALRSLFPAGTIFHDTPVPMTDCRETWFQHAKKIVKPADIVFCDPDMGVIFDGPCGSTAHDAQIESALGRFERQAFGLAAVRGAWFRRGSSRVFVLLAQDKHAHRLIEAVDEMRSMAWCQDGHLVIVRSTPDKEIAEFAADQPIGNVQFETGTASANLGRQSDADATPTWPAERITEGRVVTVVLNDNGGLNLVANPWLAEIGVPCRLETGRTTFTVIAAFQGRRDMYRTTPSTLNLARQYGFAHAHLSKSAAISFEAAIWHIARQRTYADR